MSGIWRGCFIVLAAAGWIALAPTAQFLQTVAWDTVQEYYRK
ncbi:MAG: hypothetical protein JWR80_8821 [Bradyrhizobium sp.]|jgi:hypothetical protein|nr:hypothetical protein [Bradyrhizobium sp.]